MTLREIFEALARGVRVRHKNWPKDEWIGVVGQRLVDERGNKITGASIPTEEEEADGYILFEDTWMMVGDKLKWSYSDMECECVWCDHEIACFRGVHYDGTLSANGVTRSDLKERKLGGKVEHNRNGVKVP